MEGRQQVACWSDASCQQRALMSFTLSGAREEGALRFPLLVLHHSFNYNIIVRKYAQMYISVLRISTAFVSELEYS